MNEDYQRILQAIDVIAQYAMIDGSHHKQWVIDQVLHALLGEQYDAWVARYNADEDYEDWDTGIAP